MPGNLVLPGDVCEECAGEEGGVCRAGGPGVGAATGGVRLLWSVGGQLYTCTLS